MSVIIFHPQAGDSADMLGSVWEFPRSRLRLQTVLGEGNFGKVWKAEADDICGYDGTILVAVKTVKVINPNILAQDWKVTQRRTEIIITLQAWRG